MTSSSLQFDKVEFFRGGFTLKVDIEFPKSLLTVVLGPSGSGKTTLLDLAAGFIAPETGRIIEGGLDVTNMPPESRKVGVVFQEHALFPHLSVKDNVAFGPTVRGMGRKAAQRKARQYLDLVKMGDFADRRPATLSGGERQRVALARALATDPQLLLLDEPFSALDAALRRELRRDVKKIQEQTGITALLVTHDQEEAMALADHLALMKDGRIEQSGAPREIWENPRTLFTGLFLGRSTRLAVHRYSQNSKGSPLVVTAAGTIPLPSGSDMPTLPATVLLRPNAARLDPAGQLGGLVTGSEYSEGTWRLRLKPERGGEHDLLEIDYDGPDVPRPGQKLTAAVEAESVRVLSGST